MGEPLPSRKEISRLQGDVSRTIRSPLWRSWLPLSSFRGGYFATCLRFSGDFTSRLMVPNLFFARKICRRALSTLLPHEERFAVGTRARDERQG